MSNSPLGFATVSGLWAVPMNTLPLATMGEVDLEGVTRILCESP